MESWSTAPGWYNFPVALLLTCVIEIPAYLLAFGVLSWARHGKTDSGALSWPAAAVLALAVNLLTHPIFWHVAVGLPGPAVLLIGEAVVAVTEGLVIFIVVLRHRGEDSAVNRFGWSMITAFAVNALSLSVGLIMNAL